MSDYVYTDNVADYVLDLVPGDGKVIGSIGCGPAATEAELVKQGREVHGVDIAPEAIERAAPRLTSARLVDPDTRCPFEASSLDGLILADVIEHLPLAWERLTGFVEAVKPGGWVVISVPNMRNLKLLSELMVKGDWPEAPAGICDRTHVQVMSRKRLLRWCDAAGLDVTRVTGTYLSAGSRRRVIHTADVLTLGLISEWLFGQIQVLARRGSRDEGLS